MGRALGARGGYVIAAVVAVLLGCGKTTATLKFRGLDTTEQAAVAIPPGGNVMFAVHLASYRGQNYIMLDVDLLKDERVVGHLTCRGFDIDGSGCGATEYHSSCSMKAPAEGANAVRVTTRLDNDRAVKIEGLEVQVRQ